MTVLTTMMKYHLILQLGWSVLSSAFVSPAKSIRPMKLYDESTSVDAEGSPLSSILVTFDLDDTLFPIQEVVQEANDA